MEYGIPIPKWGNLTFDNIITPLTSTDFNTKMEDIFDNMVIELGETATKTGWIGGGDDGHTTRSISVPNLNGINKVCVSWESLIGFYYNGVSTPSISTKWNASWSRMYYDGEPNLFICIRPQDNSNDLGMHGTSIAYNDDRVVVFAHYHFRDGNTNNNFKIIVDVTKNIDSPFGVNFDIYYMSSGNNLNPYVWGKFPYTSEPTKIDILNMERTSINGFYNGSYTLTKKILYYDPKINYYGNVKIDNLAKVERIKIPYKINDVNELKRGFNESTYRTPNFYTNHKILNNSLNTFKLGNISDIDRSDWNKTNADWISLLNQESYLKPYIHFKGFIEGKETTYNDIVKFVNGDFNQTIKANKGFYYDFHDYVDSKNIYIIVDNIRRKLDLNKPMLKGYISGKVNTSGCSGQDFIIRCYRHSNNDFIGEYKVDASGNYFIPNLNYLDEYNIMLVDKNSIIETKVSSKRKPILNDEIKELKLEVHTSSLNMDFLSIIKYKSLLDTYGIWIWNLASTMATENVNFLKDIRNPDYETLFENTEDFCFYNYKHVTNSWSSDTGWVNNFLINKSPIGKVFEVHLYNGTYSYTCADTHLEFKDDDDNIIAVMKFERDSSYQSGIWYGTSWNTITKASQSGSYPQTTGILEFLNDRIVYTNTRNTGGWNNSFTYMNSNLHKVTKINVLKARAYMDYPNTHTQFRMVEIEV